MNQLEDLNLIAKKCKFSKMSHRPLTDHARKVVEQSDLSNMSRRALEGIVKLEKSAQCIHKAHIEEIVRFLLEQLKWFDDGLDMGEIRQCWSFGPLN